MGVVTYCVFVKDSTEGIFNNLGGSWHCARFMANQDDDYNEAVSNIQNDSNVKRS